MQDVKNVGTMNRESGYMGALYNLLNYFCRSKTIFKKSINFFNVNTWFRSRIFNRVFNSLGEGRKSSTTETAEQNFER